MLSDSDPRDDCFRGQISSAVDPAQLVAFRAGQMKLAAQIFSTKRWGNDNNLGKLVEKSMYPQSWVGAISSLLRYSLIVASGGFFLTGNIPFMYRQQEC